MRIRLFRQSVNRIINRAMLSLGIKYSMRDLIFDVNYCAWGAKLRYASDVSSGSVSVRSP